MSLDDALAFLRSHHRAVLLTHRSDGGPQLSPVLVGHDAEGRALVSVTADRAKTANARRDPRVAFCVLPDEFFGAWTMLEGRAEVVSLPEALDLLVETYRSISGEHPDWDEYRAAMERERRCVLRITVERATGPAA